MRKTHLGSPIRGVGAHRPRGHRTAPRPEVLPREAPLRAGGTVYAPIELAPQVTRHLERVRYEGPSDMDGRLFRIRDWESWSMPKKLAFLRAFVEDTARDPKIAAKAVRIIRQARAPLRDHEREWEALLRWVQRNVRFTAEPNERIQSPQYTLTERMGDCDDLHVALAALAHSIRLPWWWAVSGRDAKGNKRRWVEGSGPCPTDVSWTHIYLLAGWPPFRPRFRAWAEATLDVPLGWDSMKVGKIEGRSDLSGAVSRESPAMGVLVNRHKRGWPLLQEHLGKLPWRTILGSVVGSVLTAVVVRSVLRPSRDDSGETRGR